MIAGLKGRIETKLPDALFVDVGGVVYRVNTTGTTLGDVGAPGEMVYLHTHLFVREDQMTLYGFAGTDELRLFETLIGITGVGPRLACTILTKMRPDALAVAIVDENADLLATVPGVGRKTASRLILELRGKLVPPAEGTVGGTTRADTEVVEALRALGYTVAEAHAAAARTGAQMELPIEERVVAALRDLAQG